MRPASNYNNAQNAKKYVIGEFIYWVLWVIVIAITIVFFKLFTFVSILENFPVLHTLLLLIISALSFYLSLCVVGFLLPRPKPGLYKTGDKMVVIWFVNFQFAKIWQLPLVRHFIFASFLLRPIFLRACGAKISFNMAPSVYSRINDPSMVSIGAGAILGLDVIISGHSFIGDKLCLMRVKIGQNCNIGAYSSITAGTTIGDNCNIGRNCTLYPLSKLPNGVTIGHSSEISHGMKIKEGDILPPYSRVF